MRILGIDPGSLKTGYGVIESEEGRLKLIASGCIRNTSRDNISKRFKKIYSELTDIIKKTKPEAVSLENVIYCNNTSIAIKLGEARGIAILACADCGIEVSEYAPKKIKQAAVGSGNASKVQVQNMIKNILGLSALPQQDEADALAAALCHINSERVKALQTA